MISRCVRESNVAHTQTTIPTDIPLVHSQAVYDLLSRPDISSEAKLRLAILYALRYQKYSGNHISNIVKKLLDSGLEESKAGVRGV